MIRLCYHYIREQSMNHISLNKGRPRCYAQSPTVSVITRPHQVCCRGNRKMGTDMQYAALKDLVGLILGTVIHIECDSEFDSELCPHNSV